MPFYDFASENCQTRLRFSPPPPPHTHTHTSLSQARAAKKAERERLEAEKEAERARKKEEAELARQLKAEEDEKLKKKKLGVSATMQKGFTSFFNVKKKPEKNPDAEVVSVGQFTPFERQPGMVLAAAAEGTTLAVGAISALDDALYECNDG
jgi:hypothetical protein